MATITKVLTFVVALLPASALAQHRTDSGIARVRGEVGISPEVIGLAVSVRALKPVELDAGAGVFGWHVRAGLPIPLGKNGNTQFEAIPAIGWGKFWDYGELFLDTVPRDIPHGTISLGVTRWFADHFGLEARLTGGAAYALDVENSDGTTDKGGFFPIVTLGAGFTF